MGSRSREGSLLIIIKNLGHNIVLGNNEVETVSSAVFLGITIDSKLQLQSTYINSSGKAVQPPTPSEKLDNTLTFIQHG